MGNPIPRGRRDETYVNFRNAKLAEFAGGACSVLALCQSGRGQQMWHNTRDALALRSLTLHDASRAARIIRKRDSVLECGCLLPLSMRQSYKNWDTLFRQAKIFGKFRSSGI